MLVFLLGWIPLVEVFVNAGELNSSRDLFVGADGGGPVHAISVPLQLNS